MRMSKMFIYCVVSLSVLAAITVISAECPYDYILGEWKFNVGNVGWDKDVKCSTMGITDEVRTIKLLYPDLAIDEFGNRGFWTTIACYGIEVIIHGRAYTAYLIEESTTENRTTYCSDTHAGWSRDAEGHDWACFQAHRLIANTIKPPVENETVPEDVDLDELYMHDADWLEQINEAQTLWKAKRYVEHETMTLHQLRQRAGGKGQSPTHPPASLKASRQLQDDADRLPLAFDWRDVDGHNYISPIRQQDGCGSCYAFAMAAMLEARLRIHTKNAVDITLSPQDVVDCSSTSWGCNGGWPYVEAGIYAEHHGLVEEQCNPYRANVTGVCETDTHCRRHYMTGHRYVGGYYGGTNEEAMRLSLVQNGPVVSAFWVSSDFFAYEKGIYRRIGLERRFDPYVAANHAVLLIGYGIENGTKFWTLKNSWGDQWGEDGYFRILRGENEAGIEGEAVEAFPVF